jgi:arginase family enzyme
VDRSVIAMLCRISDRDQGTVQGAAALGRVLEARTIGSPGTAATRGWEEDLRTGRGCLLEAGGQVDDALEAGRVPVLLSGDCSVCVSTLPVVARRHPDAMVLWIDAHGDFNTPDTTASQFLGGMCLAGACGLWDTGFGGDLEPARVVMTGVRDLDGPEQVLLETNGVGRVDRPGALADLLDARKVFVHLDLDVLDPEVLPAAFPAPGGLQLEQLKRLLTLVCEASDLVGAEVTNARPELVDELADVLAPLL